MALEAVNFDEKHPLVQTLIPIFSKEGEVSQGEIAALLIPSRTDSGFVLLVEKLTGKYVGNKAMRKRFEKKYGKLVGDMIYNSCVRHILMAGTNWEYIDTIFEGFSSEEKKLAYCEEWSSEEFFKDNMNELLTTVVSLINTVKKLAP